MLELNGTTQPEGLPLGMSIDLGFGGDNGASTAQIIGGFDLNNRSLEGLHLLGGLMTRMCRLSRPDPTGHPNTSTKVKLKLSSSSKFSLLFNMCWI